MPSHSERDLALIERTRQNMVRLSIPAGADPVQLVERIGEEMAYSAGLRSALEAIQSSSVLSMRPDLQDKVLDALAGRRCG